MDYIAVE